MNISKTQIFFQNIMIEDYIFKKQQKHSMVIRDNMSPCPEIIICDFSYENIWIFYPPVLLLILKDSLNGTMSHDLQI
jgi:hypothetical protein